MQCVDRHYLYRITAAYVKVRPAWLKTVMNAFNSADTSATSVSKTLNSIVQQENAKVLFVKYQTAQIVEDLATKKSVVYAMLITSLTPRLMSAWKISLARLKTVRSVMKIERSAIAAWFQTFGLISRINASMQLVV